MHTLPDATKLGAPLRSPLPTIAAAALAAATAAADHHGEGSPDGFTPLFDGVSLDGWDGKQAFWRVEDGAIVGETSESNQPEDGKNTFLVYTGGEFGDFELRFQYQVEGFNSGVQYRSSADDDHHVQGLQADFEARWHTDRENPDTAPIDRFTGMFFEEGGRMFLGQRGDVVVARPATTDGEKASVEKIGSVGDPAELEAAIRRDGWNDYTIIANGNQFTHIVNGRVMAIGFDEDAEHFKASGAIAFQLHSGKPMKIMVRDIKVRELAKP